MNDLYSLDLETSSAAPLQTVGAAAYLAHPSTVCLMAAYHPVGDPSAVRLWCRGEPVPEELIWHVGRGGSFTGWNVISFDRVGWRLLLEPLGFPAVPDDNWRDSMHLAAAANLPRSLDGAAKAVGLQFQTDLKDSNRIRRITDQKRTPITMDPFTGAVQFGDRSQDLKPGQIAGFDDDMRWLRERCVQDVVLEEQVLLRLPPWPDMRPWLAMPAIDRKINDRGVLLDIPLVEGMAFAAAKETARLDRQMHELTKGEVPKTTNIESLKKWLLAKDIDVPRKDVRKPDDDSETLDGINDDDDRPETVEEKGSPYRLRKNDIANLLSTDLPDDCREALYMRAEAAKASVRKLRKMLAVSSADGRIHGALTLMGAQATGRFASGGAQLHNMVRDAFAKDYENIAEKNGLHPKKDKVAVKRLATNMLATAIEMGRTGDHELLRMMYETPRKDLQGRVRIEGVLPWVSRMMRRTIAAQQGRIIVNGDFANIQARIPVWLAGQQETVDAFARGEDLYRIQASPVYGIPPDQLSAEQRQIGKVMRLFLGFAAGPNAFIPAAMVYGISIPREQGQYFVNLFRETNKPLVKFWDNNLACACAAIMNPGQEFHVAPTGLVSWFVYENCLCMKLPSGRLLRYWEPRLEQGYWKDGTPKLTPDLTFLMVKGKFRFRRTLWRGLAMQNCLARDSILLTNSGGKRIIDITRDDLLWDGEHWVTHEGVIFKGLRETIDFGGVRLTSEHKVDLNAEWRECGSVSYDDVACSYERHYRVPDWNAGSNRTCRIERKETYCLADPMRLRCEETHADAQIHVRRSKVLRMQSRRPQERSEAKFTNTWNVKTPRVSRVGIHAGSLSATYASGLEKLRRARDKGLLKVEQFVRKVLGRYGTNVRSWFNTGAKKQQWSLSKDKLRMDYREQTSPQQTIQHEHRNTMGSNDRGGSIGAIWDKRSYFICTDNTESSYRTDVHKTKLPESVYDILNAGPNHRFTVIGDDGRYFIASNCTCAIEADLLCLALEHMERENVGVNLHVHDSIAAEVDEDDVDRVMPIFKAAMVEMPNWTHGLPIAADVDASARFG